MNSPSPPPAPDPNVVSQAQAAANKETAIAQARLNNVNETNPYGSVTYTETPGVDGTPGFSRNISLSPEQQQLYNLQTESQRKLGELGSSQLDRISGLLDKPFDVNEANAVEGRLFDLGSRRLDPQFQRDEDALRTRLANQGITQGSEAFNNELEQFRQSKNDAYDQLALNGRQQAMQELLAERDQPLNEITALMSGSQVSAPTFAPPAQTGIAPTDVVGAYGLNQAAQNAAYQGKVATGNANTGALGGLAGAAMTAAAIF